MKQKSYETLIAELESRSARNPQSYRLALGALAMLGYVYVGVILLLLLAATGALGWRAMHGKEAMLDVKLIFIVLVFAYAVMKAMFVKLVPPSGREITRDEAPELFSAIEQVRAQTGAPAVFKVLIDDQFNASVTQYSRYSVFGGTRNYLVLGLPLLQGLSADEFKAVLAHEFGHLSGSHGKFGAWIYRLRLGWLRLTQTLEGNNHWGRFLFVPFFEWYAPKFAAYSFVQARRQEFEADALAAQTAGPAVAAAALVRVDLQAQFLSDRYWPRIFKVADAQAPPDARPFSGMQTAFVENLRSDAPAERTLTEILKARTGFADTHPCLSDRLRAMGATPTVPKPFDSSAAETLLGALGIRLAAEFDSQWREQVTEWWQQHQKLASESKEQLARLDAEAERGELPVADDYLRAQLAEQLGDSDRALKILESLAPRAADHAPALFVLGRLKLAKGDATGISFLDQAMKRDALLRADACKLIIDYLRAQGRNEDTHAYIDLLKDIDGDVTRLMPQRLEP